MAENLNYDLLLRFLVNSCSLRTHSPRNIIRMIIEQLFADKIFLDHFEKFLSINIPTLKDAIDLLGKENVIERQNAKKNWPLMSLDVSYGLIRYTIETLRKC